MKATSTDRLLAALADQLDLAGVDETHLVVCGGTALNALGFVDRPTLDVDVVALAFVGAAGRTSFASAEPLPADLQAAAHRVAADFDLPAEWLNSGPAELLRFGLPGGCEARVVTRRYGARLLVSFLGRFDLICTKLYAYVDAGPGKHGDDLRALSPAVAELEEAAHWCRTHDPSEGFLEELEAALISLGVEHVARRSS
jgi:hypothetical protein